MPLFRFENTQACSGLSNRHAFVINELGLHDHIALRLLGHPRPRRDDSHRRRSHVARVEAPGDHALVNSNPFASQELGAWWQVCCCIGHIDHCNDFVAARVSSSQLQTSEPFPCSPRTPNFTNLHPGLTERQPIVLQVICPFDCGLDGAVSAFLRSASRLAVSSRVVAGFVSRSFSHSLSSLTR